MKLDGFLCVELDLVPSVNMDVIVFTFVAECKVNLTSFGINQSLRSVGRSSFGSGRTPTQTSSPPATDPQLDPEGHFLHIGTRSFSAPFPVSLTSAPLESISKSRGTLA